MHLRQTFSAALCLAAACLPASAARGPDAERQTADLVQRPAASAGQMPALAAVDSPIAGECGFLESWRIGGDAGAELFWRDGVVPTETAFRTALGAVRLRIGRPESEAPAYFPTSPGPFDAWQQGTGHAILIGITQLAPSLGEQRLLSVAGPGPAVALDRRLETFNPAHSAVIVASRSPVDFDFVVSAPGNLYGFTSQAQAPRWSQGAPGQPLVLARLDIDRDGDLEAIVSSAPVTALDAASGNEVWSGQSSGFRGSVVGDLDGDGILDLVLYGGTPAVAIYAGASAALVGQWSGDEVLDASAGDGNGDGIDELVVATAAGQLIELGTGATSPRLLASGIVHRQIAHHRFAGRPVADLVGVEGQACGGDLVVRSTTNGAVLARNVRSIWPERIGKVGELGGDHGAVLAHTFRLDTNEPPSLGVRVVDIATRRTLFTTRPEGFGDRRFLVDIAISHPRGATPRQLWSTGTASSGERPPWIAVESLLDGSPLRFARIGSLPGRFAHGIHLLPASDGLADRVLLTTAGGTSSDNSLRAHWIDPATLQPVGPALALGDEADAHVQVVDADADGELDIVVRSYGRIASYALADGALRWEAPVATGASAMAVLPAHDPPLVVHANTRGFPVARRLVLLDARTGTVIGSATVPFDPRALGAVPGADDELVIGDFERTWHYALSTATATPLEPVIGPGFGHRGTYPAAQVDGRPALLVDGYHGFWSTRDLGIGNLHADSFEPQP
jgi:hypothetical protein